jgi:hypothetical protein
VHPEDVVDEEHRGRSGVDQWLGADAVPVGGLVVAEQRLDPDELDQRLAQVGDVALLFVGIDNGFGVEGFGVGGSGLDGHDPAQGRGPDAGLPFLERHEVVAEVEPLLAALQHRRAVAPGDDGAEVRRDQAVVDVLEVPEAEGQGRVFADGLLAHGERLLQRLGDSSG